MVPAIDQAMEGVAGSDATLDSRRDLARDAALDTSSDLPAVVDAPGFKDLGPVGDATKGCGPRPIPFGGTLCGPSTKPCKIKVNETVISALGGSLYFGATLTLDAKGTPHVATCGGGGKYARRTGANSWFTASLPSKASRVSLVDNSGKIQLLMYGTTSTSELHERSGSGWKLLDTMQYNLLSTNALAADQGGCLHAGLIFKYKPYYGMRKGGSWTYSQLSHSGSEPTISLSPTGAPLIAYWATGMGSGYSAAWTAPPASAQFVSSLGGNTLYERFMGQAISGEAGYPKGTGHPHLFFMRKTSTDNVMTYASRMLSGSWAMKTVAAVTSGKKCLSAPTGGGQTCPYDYTGRAPLDIVASGGGDVRLLYSTVRRHGTAVAKYSTSGYWYWSYPGMTTVERLVTAWPDGGGFKTAVLSNSFSHSGRAWTALDKSGIIHMVHHSPLTGGHDLRYFQIGP